MRITNQMVSGNSLRNMQRSMSSVNKTTQQLTTGKKISQASEDPVIAVRALKLRTTVNQLEQYKQKNIPDATSWFEITQTSLDNVTKRLTDIQTYCVQGSTDSFSSSDRGAIIDSLKQLKNMLYGEGNSSYAGRYIFSGYKTDRALTFTETEDASIYSYDITQHFTSKDIDTKTFVSNEVDYADLDAYISGTKEYNKPESKTVYRLNLAYEGISKTNNNGDNVLALSLKDANGNNISLGRFKTTVKTTDDAKTYYEVGDNDINIIEETGEIVFGKNVYDTIRTAEDVEITYAKKEFEPADLRPEHYFDCKQYVVQSDGTVKDYTYTDRADKQAIYYEVNFNQSIQVNTEGRDLISEEMTNNINDLIYSLQDMQDAETVQAKLKEMLGYPQYSGNDAALERINNMLADVEVEIAIKKEKLQKTFSANIENFQGYMDEVSAMQSDLGSRMSKLTMIETRVTEQYATFKELRSQNEDVESDEIMIDFTEASLIYQSALAATGNIARQTLLDYL